MSAVVNEPINKPVLTKNIDNGIATLTLNRPDQYNALSKLLLTELQQALDQTAADESVNVVILVANGKAFCAGHDLKEMRSSEDREFHQALFQQCGRVMQTIAEMPQPVIAQVDGIATAAGCQLVAQCDLAVASDVSRFAVSGINVGLFCSTPAVALSRNMHRKQAMQMLLTGDFIDAQTACDYGLVNSVTPVENVAAETRALAEKIAAKSPLAIKTGKRMFYKQLNMGLSEAYDFASDTMACNMDSEDAREGIDAFIEKRKPCWQGR
ncbi:MAG: enoyl-CoA hydratase [Gammaproteobacteria bacterium]|nr:enoyl-CoA hydratase [Gammaproteobacteria bacterium]